MSLLQMSFSGAILIIVIIILRVAAIHRLPKKTFLILWEIVLLRLLIPFSIPSIFSVYTLMSNDRSTSIFSGTGVGNLMPATLQQEQILTEQRTGQLVTEASLPVSVWHMVWLIGMILFTAFFAVSYWRCFKEFQTSLPVQNEYAGQWLKQWPLKRSISIRQSDRISAPLTYGIFRPVILMPKKISWDNESQLQYIFLHEYVHIYRFDAIAKLFVTAALCMHWFNPLVWVMYILFNLDIELACDEGVVRQLGEGAKSEYARVLIDMEAKQSGLFPLCNSFSENAIEKRIRSIMKTKKATIGLTISSMALVLAVMVLFVTSMKNQQMVFVSGRLFVTTNQDVSEMVAEGTEAMTLPIGAIRSVVSRAKEPAEELQSNFGNIGAEIVWNGAGIAVDLNGKWIQFDPRDSMEQPEKDIRKTVNQSVKNEETVAALIKEVSADSITVDTVEFIEAVDTDRITELELTEADMPDGYYIFNPSKELTTWKCNADTVFTFMDWHIDFTKGDCPQEYTTMDIAEFQKYIESYQNAEPRMPFFFTIENGYIQKIIEKPLA